MESGRCFQRRVGFYRFHMLRGHFFVRLAFIRQVLRNTVDGGHSLVYVSFLRPLWERELELTSTPPSYNDHFSSTYRPNLASLSW